MAALYKIPIRNGKYEDQLRLARSLMQRNAPWLGQSHRVETETDYLIFDDDVDDVNRFQEENRIYRIESASAEAPT